MRKRLTPASPAQEISWCNAIAKQAIDITFSIHSYHFSGSKQWFRRQRLRWRKWHAARKIKSTLKYQANGILLYRKLGIIAGKVRVAFWVHIYLQWMTHGKETVTAVPVNTNSVDVAITIFGNWIYMRNAWIVAVLTVLMMSWFPNNSPHNSRRKTSLFKWNSMAIQTFTTLKWLKTMLSKTAEEQYTLIHTGHQGIRDYRKWYSLRSSCSL